MDLGPGQGELEALLEGGPNQLELGEVLRAREGGPSQGEVLRAREGGPSRTQRRRRVRSKGLAEHPRYARRAREDEATGFMTE